MYYFGHLGLDVDCLAGKVGVTCECVLRDVYIGGD